MRQKQNHLNDLRHARRRMRLTPRAAGWLVGKNRSSILRYESGAVTPTLEAAFELEILYRTPVAFLFPDLYNAIKTRIREAEERHARIHGRPVQMFEGPAA